MGQKRALLIGIDHYENGSRPGKLNDLHGCVNDVNNMSRLLRTFGFDHQEHLISPRPLSVVEGNQPPQQAVGLPSFDNIKTYIKRLLQESQDGDLFFFHFSGHGAPLPRINKSPLDGRKEDPSLLPMDFCCEKLAMRGWQLNALLKPFCDKGVHVVISLDSCFSGGSWRDHNTTRSPADWKPPPNLPSDQLVEEEPVGSQTDRHGKLNASWDINAEGLIVMTACSDDQKAQEVEKNGKIYGAFTYELYHMLSRCTSTRLPMYYNIRNHIANRHPSQTPRIFGKDKLVFLETTEMFVQAPVRAEMKGRRALLPIGKIHGVIKGAVFVSRLSEPEVVLKVDDVSDLTSKGEIERDMDEQVMEFVPFQWYSEKSLMVDVDPNTEGSFRTALQAKLQERIASEVNIERNETTASDEDTTAANFRLRRSNNNELCISGPAMLGQEGPIRGPNLQGASTEERVVRTADALAHLFRFCQVYELRKDASVEPEKFNVALSKQTSPENPLSEGEELQYTFYNEDREDLYLTVINLGPGFQIEQLFPPENMPERIPPGRGKTITIAFSIPPQLESERPYRDVIRTVVTRGETQGFKSLELPDIWDTATMECGVPRGPGRTATFRGSSFAWWIVDHEVYTRRSL